MLMGLHVTESPVKTNLKHMTGRPRDSVAPVLLDLTWGMLCPPLIGSLHGPSVISISRQDLAFLSRSSEQASPPVSTGWLLSGHSRVLSSHFLPQCWVASVAYVFVCRHVPYSVMSFLVVPSWWLHGPSAQAPLPLRQRRPGWYGSL